LDSAPRRNAKKRGGKPKKKARPAKTKKVAGRLWGQIMGNSFAQKKRRGGGALPKGGLLIRILQGGKRVWERT